MNAPWLCVYCDHEAGKCACDNTRNPCRFTQRAAGGAPVSGDPKSLALQALERARHDLVCCDRLLATDLTAEQFAEKVAAGVPRQELEFTIDNTATIAALDIAIKAAA
jgi:hypothetical protein